MYEKEQRAEKKYCYLQNDSQSVLTLYFDRHFRLGNDKFYKSHNMHKKKIGLLGGSFNPAHEGHVRITLSALKQFGLDEVWWLVSPGNPLKEQSPEPMPQRIHDASQLITHPRVLVSNIEEKIGSHFTADTLAALTKLHPLHKFVWLMGADNLRQIDQWQNWHFIFKNFSIGVLARPGDQMAPLQSRAARVYRSYRLPMSQSHKLSHKTAPCWCYINLPMSDMSSTKLRSHFPEN